MEEFETELERRLYAMGLVVEGIPKAEVARRVGRSREWLHKWLRRFGSEGPAGLVDRSRAPHRHRDATCDETVDVVLGIRDELEEDPRANKGALSILATMERRGYTSIPSVATIERILSRAGRTRPAGTTGRSGNKLPLPKVTDAGVWQQADWIHDRYLEGGTRFQSLQIADVGSHGITSGQYLDRRLATAVTFLLEEAWPVLSIPQAMGTDNAFTHTTHRYNPFTTWARVCLFFGVEVIVCPPGSHGWNNHIEAANNLWQLRTIRAQRFDDLDQLRAASDRVCWWFNHRRPILNPDVYGTRYPAEYINAQADGLRWLPDISVVDHLDADGSLRIPLTVGRVTFIRHVTEDHTVSVAGATWEVPSTISKGGLVIATIKTEQRTLTIGHQGETAVTYPYPIGHPVGDPYYPPTERSLLHHLSAMC